MVSMSIAPPGQPALAGRKNLLLLFSSNFAPTPDRSYASANIADAGVSWQERPGHPRFHPIKPRKKNKFSNAPTLFGNEGLDCEFRAQSRLPGRSRTMEAKQMNEEIATGQNESMTRASSGTPGGRRPSLPRPVYWPCLGLVIVGAVRILVCGEVDLAGLTILAAGLIPLVRFRNEG